MSGYKIVDRRTGTPYPIPDVFDRYEVALFVVKDCKLGTRVAIVPASFDKPFVLSGKVYPCPAKDEPIPKLTYYGSGPKRVMVQEHPCLFSVAEKVKKYPPPRKMCHHALCARKAHRNGYECSCPAGDEPMPKTYGVSGVKRVAVREHPCQIHAGKRCHHVWCAWEAHRSDDYQCPQATPPVAGIGTDGIS